MADAGLRLLGCRIMSLSAFPAEFKKILESKAPHFTDAKKLFFYEPFCVKNAFLSCMIFILPELKKPDMLFSLNPLNRFGFVFSPEYILKSATSIYAGNSSASDVPLSSRERELKLPDAVASVLCLLVALFTEDVNWNLPSFIF